jgi:hypothetical protein
VSGSKKRKLKLHQKLSKKPSRKVPNVPKSFFLRDCVPPPSTFMGKLENEKHYKYKIFLGETIRDRMPFLTSIEYDYQSLPDFFHARYDRYLSYLPDIFIKFIDDTLETIFICDIEINGLIHYKNKNQILKCKERKDHIYPYLQNYREPDREREHYKTMASYIVFDVDDFEYNTISELFDIWKIWFFGLGGVYPERFDAMLVEYLKVAN